MNGCMKQFANSLIKASPNDDKALRSWLLLPLVQPDGDYTEEMRRAKALVYGAFSLAVDVLRMPNHFVHSDCQRRVNLEHELHAKWLEDAITKGETPKELYGKARASTATRPGHVLACIDLLYHAGPIPPPPGSKYKWIYHPEQELRSLVISYALSADLSGLSIRGNHWDREPCRPGSAGAYAGKCFAAYGELVGPRAYELAADTMRKCVEVEQ